MKYEQGTAPVEIEADSLTDAIEKFADYVQAQLGAWEYGGYREGEQAVGVRVAENEAVNQPCNAKGGEMNLTPEEEEEMLWYYYEQEEAYYEAQMRAAEEED